MAMSDEEKKKLLALSADDLIEMFAAMREERDKLDTKYRDERKKLIAAAMQTQPVDEDAGEDDGSALDLKKNRAFERLKKKIF